jgi:hypothetical protein
LVYTVSLFVVARSTHWNALTALGKGLIQLAFGLAAAGAVVYKLLHPALPAAEVVSRVGLFSLAGNLTCPWLPLRHRDEDLNVNSVRLCRVAKSQKSTLSHWPSPNQPDPLRQRPLPICAAHIVDVTDRRLCPNLSIEADRSESPDRLT